MVDEKAELVSIVRGASRQNVPGAAGRGKSVE